MPVNKKQIDIMDIRREVREGRFKVYVARGMIDFRMTDVVYLKDSNGEVIQLGEAVHE